MNTNTLLLFLTIFLASAVEVVEMVAIVLGVGLTRGWRATIGGIVAALLVLSGVVAVLGPALTLIPISVLRATVGILLLLFGSQWLRKGILRINLYGFSSPNSSDYDEETILQNGPDGMDWTAFVLSFKGVLLEGLEVVFIVVTFGSATSRIGLAALSATAACVAIVALAFLIQRKMRDIPRHIVKYSVGLLLVTFGTFWAAEGLGVEWPGEDLSILFLLALYFLFSIVCLYWLRRTSRSPLANNSKGQAAASRLGYLKQFAWFWYQFLIGDDWLGAAIIVFGFVATCFFVKTGITAFWLLPVIVMLSSSLSLLRHTAPQAAMTANSRRPTESKIS
jgi:uncharacterized membrane protein